MFTTQYNKGESIEDLEYSNKVDVKYSAWWIPRSFLGLFRGFMSILKSAWMAFRIVFNPPKVKPSLILLDINLVALFLLHFFSHYKLFYVQLMESIRENPELCEHTKYFPTLFEAKWIKLADIILVETDGFAEIFKQSFPALNQDPIVLYPSIDIGLWKEPAIKIQRIIPDLLDNTTIFLTVGKFRRSTNFKLALDAFELLLQLIDDRDMTRRFQLVIAGNCKTLDENCTITSWYP
ncbi:alpha-1,3/1,6-mannosyltransferase ALG2-like [Sitophilus oryzae]|uniref:Alpha-1,3/1,6-mannosyltransferase ALG2 n=1 Tax=Sitophilus oryzae TaxID=7048 RepID=A0A6J2X923_SITOR|nr:alpha-1,3/1,6-mannosyltransferase ALG2-like [Sitophilus oryzae]